MIKYNEIKLKKINSLKNSDVYIIIDFDRTITTSDSESSWGIISKSALAPKEYKSKSKELYEKYHPFEIDNRLNEEEKNILMCRWWEAHINILVEHKIDEKIISDVQKLKELKLRRGAIEFLKRTSELNIPVIILSAGIGNIIDNVLKENKCYYQNICVISNFIGFKNGYATGFKDNNYIHSNNKNETLIPQEMQNIIKDRFYPILIGDSLGDLKMSNNKNVYKIGFLNNENISNEKVYLQNFDMVCYDETGFDEIINIIKIFELIN